MFISNDPMTFVRAKKESDIMNLFYTLLNIFAFGILYIATIRRIQLGKDKSVHLGNYKNLTESEKDIYDINKIKTSEIVLLLICYVLYALGIFGFAHPNKGIISIIIITLMIFLILIFWRTKIILNLFCKKHTDSL